MRCLICVCDINGRKALTKFDKVWCDDAQIGNKVYVEAYEYRISVVTFLLQEGECVINTNNSRW